MNQIQQQSIESLFAQAAHAHQNGEIKKAKALYEYILLKPALHANILYYYAQVHNNLASLLHKQNKLIEANGHYKQAIQLKPDYLAANFNLGLVFLAQNEHAAAIKQFKQVVKLHPQFTQAHWQLANIYWKKNQLEKVHYHYQKILELEPCSAELLNNFAALMLKKNHVDKAIDYFKQALSIDPKHKIARNNLATCLLQKNQFQQAIWHYSLTLNLDPLDKEALFNRAHGLMLIGQLNEAILDLKKILSIDKTQIDTYCNLAAIYLKLGDKSVAANYYQQILNLQPTHPIASYMLSALTQQSIPSHAPIDYIKNLFNNYAFHFDMHLQTVLRYKTPELLREQLTPFLKARKYQILDLGCGTGLSGMAFSDIRQQLTGIDISSNMLNKAKEKACYDSLIENDILNGLAQLNHSFDLILCVDTLVYFGDLTELFVKTKKCLTKNGLFAFSIELADEHIASYQLQTTGRYQHAKCYIDELAKHNNLKLVKFINVEGRQQENKSVITGLFIFTY